MDGVVREIEEAKQREKNFDLSFRETASYYGVFEEILCGK